MKDGELEEATAIPPGAAVAGAAAAAVGEACNASSAAAGSVGSTAAQQPPGTATETASGTHASAAASAVAPSGAVSAGNAVVAGVQPGAAPPNAKRESSSSSSGHGNSSNSNDDKREGLESSSPQARMAFRRARAEERLAANSLRGIQGFDVSTASAAAGEDVPVDAPVPQYAVAVGEVVAEQVQQLQQMQQCTWKELHEFSSRYEEKRQIEENARKQKAEERKAVLKEVVSELRQEKGQALQRGTPATSGGTPTPAGLLSAHRNVLRRATQRDTESARSVSSAATTQSLLCSAEELLSLSCPLELCAAFEETKELCAAADEKKKKTEQQLDDERDMQDEAFVNALKEQREELSQLIELMRNQYQELQTGYREALRAIEDKMAQERSDRMAKNKEELSALFERRKIMEEHEIIDSRNRLYEGFEEALDQQRQKDEIDHQARKLEQQRVIQELERHLDKMMAAYQLNKEKLDYNVQVLTERNKENAALVLAYKNKANKSRSVLSVIIEKFNSMDKKYSLANAHYTEEFRRLRSQYQQIREQGALFKSADEKIYKETWHAHEQEARQLVALLLDADRSIHEQQLCLPFTAPAEAEAGGSGFPEEETTTYDGMSEAATTTFHSGSSSGKVDSFQKNHGAPSVSAFSACRSLIGTRSKEDSERTGTEGRVAKSCFSAEKVKKALDLVGEACRFLIASHGKQTEDLTEEEQRLVEVHSILESVGVTCQADLDLLVSMFYQGQDDDDETLYFDADDVLRLLEDFMEEKHNLALADLVPDNDKKRKNRQQTQALDQLMRRYYRVLVSRSEVLAQILVAERRCESLSKQLQAFEKSSINQELLVPPVSPRRRMQQARKGTANAP